MNFGIIGAGFIARVHAAAIKNIDGSRVSAIADVQSERACSFASEFGCDSCFSAEELLCREDIDAVIICVPPFLHEEIALQAISHKKHVLCEKPMALSLSSCQNMAKAAENAGVLLMVAQVLRFWPEYRLVHQQVESGAIGDVKMLSAKRLGQYPSWGEWFKDPEKSGGALMDLHLHDVDFIVSMLGYDVAPIYSVGHQSSSGAFEQMFTLLSFANGTKACVHASNQMPDNYPFTMELNIYGTKGAVELRIGAGYNIHKEGGAESSVNLYQNGSMPQLLIPECDDAYETQLKHFITAVQSGQSSKAVPVGQSLGVIRIMEQIKQALLSGDVVRP